VTRALALAVLLGGTVVAPTIASADASIAAIVAAPESYRGQQVTVVGTVSGPIGYAGESVYTLFDAGRRITVFSKTPPPAAGDRVAVGAKVGWREGDEEFTWPPVLLESERHPAP